MTHASYHLFPHTKISSYLILRTVDHVCAISRHVGKFVARNGVIRSGVVSFQQNRASNCWGFVQMHPKDGPANHPDRLCRPQQAARQGCLHLTDAVGGPKGVCSLRPAKSFLHSAHSTCADTSSKPATSTVVHPLSKMGGLFFCLSRSQMVLLPSTLRFCST